MTSRTLIVDGTKEIIANGRTQTMHAICASQDYTHTRIVGYAVTEEDAALFAAAEEGREANRETILALATQYSIPDAASDEWIYDTLGSALADAYFSAREAISKSEIR